MEVGDKIDGETQGMQLNYIIVPCYWEQAYLS